MNNIALHDLASLIANCARVAISEGYARDTESAIMSSISVVRDLMDGQKVAGIRAVSRGGSRTALILEGGGETVIVDRNYIDHAKRHRIAVFDARRRDMARRAKVLGNQLTIA